MKTVSDYLLEAARIVDAGWCKGEFFVEQKGKVSFCALGALQFAFGLRDASGRRTLVGLAPPPAEYDEAIRALHKVVGENISVWNDDYARTKEQVVAGLETAARKLRLEAKNECSQN